jgi:hypothetical protein
MRAGGGRIAQAVAPPAHAIVGIVDGGALVALWSAQRAERRAIEWYGMRGTPPCHDGIEALRGPRKLLPKTMDGPPLAAVASPGGGGSALATQGVRGYQAGQRFLVVECGAQRFADGGVAGGWDPLSGCTPIEHAIEALDDGIGPADTHNPRVITQNTT